MKIAFLVDRVNQYRLFGPMIDEALRNEWQVECWHDGRKPAKSFKSGQTQSLGPPPTFVQRTPVVRPFASSEELDQRLMQRQVDAVVSVGAERYYFPDGRSGRRPVWAWLQFVSDFVGHLDPHDLIGCDVLGFYSAWWVRWTAENFDAEGKLPNRVTFEAALARKASIVGVPELDAASRIDRAEVRRRWRIPEGKSVVVLLPFPQGVGKAAFWPRHIFGESSRLRQALNMLAYRRFEYWPDIRYGWNDERTVNAIKAFCDRNDALLVVKSRPKTPIPPYLRRVADLELYDESHYPATILDVLSIADLCISFYSAAVLEAIPLRVPHLCLAFDMSRYFDVDQVALGRAKRLFNPTPGGMYEFSGAATVLTVPEAIASLADRSLQDFQIVPAARRAYVEQFTGYDDHRSSERMLAAISDAVRQADTTPGRRM